MKTFRIAALGLFLLTTTLSAQSRVSPPIDAALVQKVQKKEAVLKDALFRMRDSIDRYYADHKRYPNGLDSLVTARYLRQIPVDPFTNSAHSWRTIQARRDRRRPGTSRGIYDVKSRSTATALDGTKYSDW